MTTISLKINHNVPPGKLLRIKRPTDFFYRAYKVGTRSYDAVKTWEPGSIFLYVETKPSYDNINVMLDWFLGPDGKKTYLVDFLSYVEYPVVFYPIGEIL